MRILLALALIMLVGCPAKQDQQNAPKSVATSSNPLMRAVSTKLSRPYPLKLIQAEEFPPEAAEYIEASLANLMSGGVYAPKDLTLAYMGFIPGAQIGKEHVLHEVEISGESLAPSLISAYMTVAPERCLEYVQRQVNAGIVGSLAAIGSDKEVGTWVFEHVHIKPAPDDFAVSLLGIITRLELDPENYLPNLRVMTESDDPIASGKAAGILIMNGIETIEDRQLILDYLDSDEMRTYTGGIEGLKLAGDPSLADELISIVAEAELGDLVPGSEPDMKITFAAYGLTSLDGEQAKMLREVLLQSTNGLIRLVAAIGELLHGDSSHWNKFLASGDFEDREIMSAIQPPDVWHVDLLPYYLELVDSDTPRNRLVVLEFLSRYADHSDNKTVKKILGKLLDDEDDLVRERAWLIATLLSNESYQDRALKVLQDEDEPPKVRLAAAICAMQSTVKRVNGRE